MPPTPFAPSHTTPFKSSISSSQQRRENAGRNGNNLQTSIEASTLDARDWSYLAEGARNLVVRYTSPLSSGGICAIENGRPPILRIPKATRQGTAVSGSAQTPSTVDNSTFIDKLMSPLLEFDGASMVPRAVRIDLPKNTVFLEKLSALVETSRPLHRRKKDGIDEKAESIWAIEDLTALAQVPGSSLATQGVLNIEIKPKCGFVPQPEYLSASTKPFKATYSRYRMHKVLKSVCADNPNSPEKLPNTTPIAVESWRNSYDPLDMYSGDDARIKKAITALFREWLHSSSKFSNLRIFYDGKVIDPSKYSDIERLQEVCCGTGLERNADVLVESFVSILFPVITSSIAQHSLQSLVRLQEVFDPLDIEGLEQLFRKYTGSGFSDTTSDELQREPTLEEYVKVLQSFLQSGEPVQNSLRQILFCPNKCQNDSEKLSHLEKVRSALLAYLLSATFKDCSLFIRACVPNAVDPFATHTYSAPQNDYPPIVGASGNDARSHGHEQQRALPSGSTLNIIDLDPKPIQRLAYYKTKDAHIVHEFSKWATNVGLHPPQA